MKILIIRLSAIGDIVMSTPVAANLKAIWPDAKVTWLTQPENKSLLEHNPHIDQVICWDKAKTKALFKQKKWGAALTELKTLSVQLKAEKLDLCLDMQGLMKSGVMAWLSGAKHKVGLGSKEGSQWLMDEVVARDLGDTTLISSEYRSLVKHLGYEAEFKLELYPGSKAELSARTIIDEQIGTEYVVICPFTTRPQKHWFTDYWSQLIEVLQNNLGLKVVMLGGPGDKVAADQITGVGLINLVGRTSLTEAAALIERSSGLIGVDTGLTHMGHAAGVPTLGLFGATKPYSQTGSAQSKILHFGALCSAGKHDDREEFSGCMRDLTPEIAHEAFLKLLSTQPKDQAP